MGLAGENIHNAMAAAFLLLFNYAGCTRAAATTCILPWLLLSSCCLVMLIVQELLEQCSAHNPGLYFVLAI